MANIFYHLRYHRADFNWVTNLLLPVLGIVINVYIFYKNFFQTFVLHPSSCVSPGFTHTVMTEKAMGPKLMDYLNGSFARVPMKRLVRTEEIAQAFLFLASDQASAITGIDLRVDGGLTANWYILETLPGD